MKKNKAYLITGGLGEVGNLFCQYLSKTYQSTLIILARTPLNEHLTKKIRELEDLGGKIIYESVDITNLVALNATVTKIREKTGQINGVIHMARKVQDNLMQLKTPNEFMDVIASKVTGLVNMDAVTKNDPLDFFISFSSVAAYGLKGGADYAYANAFINSFSSWRKRQVQKNQRQGRTHAIMWGQWEVDRYSNRARDELIKEMGGGLLTIPDAIEGMTAIDPGDTVFGLLAVSKDREEGNQFLKNLHLSIKKSDVLLKFEELLNGYKNKTISRKQVIATLLNMHLKVKNLENNEVQLMFELSNFLTEPSSVKTEEINVAINKHYESSHANGNGAFNVDELKSALSDILKINKTLIDDNKSFQDYGLDSIAAMRFSVELSRRLHMEVQPKWFIEYPSINQLLQRIKEVI